MIKTLLVCTNRDQLIKIEDFIADICEELKIYDNLYGNILSAISLIFEMLCEITNNERRNVEIEFEQKNKLLCFKIGLKEYYIDILQYISDENCSESDEDTVRGNYFKMAVIKKLADELNIDYRNETLEIVFYFTGVNEILTDQRIEMLSKYFSVIGNEVKQ